MKRIVIVGAGGRDFHTFNTVFRGDPAVQVVAFTAAQIPNIDHRTYPADLAGPGYPDGIPIHPQADLVDLVRAKEVDEVVFAYSDVSHGEVMHLASTVLAAGADFRLVGTKASYLHSTKPVVAVCATRTGCGKSQTSRAVAHLLADRGLRVGLVRHPMPYGNLHDMRVQRFTSLAEIDASHPTIEEREEYEQPVREGITVYAGVDYAAILALAESEVDVVLWDGGNNDLPFFAPDAMIVVADALRPGHERDYFPGEANLALADVIVLNKVDSADPAQVDRIAADLAARRPGVPVVRAASPVVLEPGPSLAGQPVLVVEDGPTLTHGGMPFGAGTVAARAAGAAIVDPRPYAVGSLVDVFARFTHLGPVLPAMGYGDDQVRDLAATIAATPCAAVVAGTPIDLGQALGASAPPDRPIRRATYDLDPAAKARLNEVLAPWIDRWAPR